MINLIPPYGKTALRREYLLRVGSIYAIMLTGVFVATVALMVPTYVYVSSELKVNTGRAEAVEKENAAYLAAEREIRDANAVVAQLIADDNDLHPSVFIDEVVRVAPKGIRFKTFSIQSDDAAYTELDVQGSAQTRATLLMLKQALEASPIFDTATIPIGDLARDTDLPFTVTVAIAREQKKP